VEGAVVQVKEAVQKAQTYLPDIFQSAKGKEVRLEGVELSDDAKFWVITFSYMDSSLIGTLGGMREYKTVKLRAEDGEFFGARNGLSSSGLM
jgi:hypothetical protein